MTDMCAMRTGLRSPFTTTLVRFLQVNNYFTSARNQRALGVDVAQ